MMPWRVALAARSGDALTTLAADLGGPAAALPISCDTTDWEQVKILPTQAMEAFGRLDAVFANAGYFTPASFLHGTGTPEQWREMVLRFTAPHWSHAQHGRPSRSTAVTCCSPAEATATGIRVILIQPSLTDTGLLGAREPGAGAHDLQGRVVRGDRCHM